jgi:hypothetical protein
VIVKTLNRALAATELLLLSPAVLFMTSLFARNLQPEPCQPAHTARRVVDWFSARPVLGLDVCLIALPLTALIIGCAAVGRAWRGDAELRQAATEALSAVRPHVTTLIIASATLVAGGILAVVATHMITD